MDRAKQRVESRGRIRERIRRKVLGTTERPRLAVFKSLKHIYVQVIDDATGKTLVAASSRDKDSSVKGSNTAAAISITATSRRSRMPRAKTDWNSRSALLSDPMTGNDNGNHGGKQVQRP